MTVVEVSKHILSLKAYYCFGDSNNMKQNNNKETVTKTIRGFGLILHEKYQNEPGEMTRLIQDSSVSDHLWVGEDHHLSKAEVKILIKQLKSWVKTGQFTEDTL